MSIFQSIQRAVGDFDWMPGTTEFEELSGESLNAEQLNIGTGSYDRPQVSKQDRTVYASNYTDPDEFIQENLPWIVAHELTFVFDENKPDWDLFVPGFMRIDTLMDTDLGGVKIIGQNSTTRQVNGMFFSGIVGRFGAIVDYIECTGEHSYDNEHSAITVSYCSEVEFRNTSLSGAITNGITAYGDSIVALNGVDFGANVCSGEGVRTKHGAFVYEQRSQSLRDTAAASLGNVGGYAYDAELGEIRYDGSTSTLTGDNSPDINVADGEIYDYGNNHWMPGEQLRVELMQDDFEVVGLEGGTSSVFKAENQGFGIIGGAQNLSGQTGDHDTQIKFDDGTNTAARGTPCVWDGENSVWRPVNDPSAGSFS